MKQLILFLLAFSSLTSVFGQSKQDGFVKEYMDKGKKKPLEGVQVLVSNANRDVSGKEGDFHLQFRTLKAGDPVHVQNIIKSGYEIFNKDQLDVWRISHKDEPFTIVMCKSSVLKALKDEYNAIAYKSYEEQRRKELNLWEEQLKQGKIKEAEYEKQIAALCDYYDQKLDNLETYIDRFARIDMSEISRRERNIVDLVRKGMIQKAIDEYNALKLDEELIKNYNDYQKTDFAIKNLTKVSQKKHAYEEDLLTSLKNKFNLMMMQGSRQAIDSILNEYEKIAEKCPNSVNILLGLVDFASQEHDFQRVAKWGRILIDLIPEELPLYKEFYCLQVRNAERFLGNEDMVHLYSERALEWLEKAMVKNPESSIHAHIALEMSAIGDLLLSENGLANSLEKADCLLMELDSLYKTVPTDEMRHTYLLGKYDIYSDLAFIFIGLNDVAGAIEYSDKSILYVDSLLMTDDSDLMKSYQANAYNTSAYYKLLIQNFSEAEPLLKKADEITKEIYKSNPYKFYPSRLVCYTYKGLLYYYTGQMDKAIELYKEAVTFAEENVESRPFPLYFTSYADIINNLGFVSFYVGDDKTAEESYLRCIEKAKTFAERNPFKHLSALCIPQINLGMLMLKQGRLDEFAAMQENYWDNTEKVYGWKETEFKISYAAAWDNKGYYALLKGDTEEALSVWKKISELAPDYLTFNSISLLYKGLKERGLIE